MYFMVESEKKYVLEPVDMMTPSVEDPSVLERSSVVLPDNGRYTCFNSVLMYKGHENSFFLCVE